METLEAVEILESIISRLEGINQDLSEDELVKEGSAIARDLRWLAREAGAWKRERP